MSSMSSMSDAYSTAGEPHNGEVEAQLRDLQRQGGGMATFAHWCAGLLLLAGSLGSLISISADAFHHFLAAAQRGQLDVPDLLNAVVGVLLVLAGDAALLYAASMLRVLRAAQAPTREATAHAAVMIGVSLMEAATYLYMAWLFDPPTTGLLWLIDIARAVAWPLLCAYLSMARPLPIGPRDIMYHSALASGKGVVRDIATMSADPARPLHHKVRIFRAASNMTAGDRAKLDTLVSELTDAHRETREVHAPLPLPNPEYIPPLGHPTRDLDGDRDSDVPHDGPDGDDDDGPHGGGGLPAPRPRPLHGHLDGALVSVSPVKYPRESRNGRASARSQGSVPGAWDWQQVRDYAATAYEVELTRTEALNLIKTCDGAHRDATKPGRPLVASRKQLEQKVRLALGIRGAGVPSPKRMAARDLEQEQQEQLSA